MAASFKKILLLAGEASGDQLGADLIRDMTQQQPNFKFYAMGGAAMQRAGANILIDFHALSIIGFVGILKNFFLLRRTFKYLKQKLLEIKPNVVVLIDYPGFNLYFAKIAKKLGFKVIFYVSPQIWAWRYGRIKKIKQRVDHMMVLFPFEQAIYQREGIPVSFVGHPLTQQISDAPQKDFQRFNLDPNKLIIGLMPGSRNAEIKRLMPVIMQSVKLIKQKHPQAQFILPLADNLPPALVQPYLNEDIQWVQQQTRQVIPLCDAIICASGTVTLEIALFKVPMVIIYKLSTFNYWLAKRLVKTPFIGLCNVVMGQLVCPELIQGDASAENIVRWLEVVLAQRSEIESKCVALQQQFQLESQSNAAKTVLRFIEKHHIIPD